MVKTALQRKTTAPVAQDRIERSLAMLAARKQFVSAALNMGWQLAGVVIIPVLIGVKLDERFQTNPSYTLAALFLAAGGVIVIVRSTIKDVSREQATTDKEKKSGK